MPLELFASGEAQWLGVLAEGGGQAEQARILLVSVPYALKAADADTLGGKPASAFMQVPLNTQTSVAQSPSSNSTTSSTSTSRLTVPFRPNVAGGGTTNFIPIWTDNSGTLGNSTLFQSGGNVGLGTTSPVGKLHIVGSTGSVPFYTHVGTGGEWQVGQNAGAGSGDDTFGFYSGTYGPSHGFLPIFQIGSGGKVTMNGGVSAGTGVKHVRAPSATCTTGNNTGNTCNITLSWPGSAFADTNYTVTCSPEKAIPGSNPPAAWMFVPPASKTTTSFVVTMETLNSLSATLTGLECIGIHD